MTAKTAVNHPFNVADARRDIAHIHPFLNIPIENPSTSFGIILQYRFLISGSE